MNPGLLVGAGFLLGTVGLKAAKSETAKKLYVKTAVQGLRLKEEAQTLVDTAKAEFDDIMAEANYENEKLNSAEEAVSTEATEAPAAPVATPAKKKDESAAVKLAEKALASATKTSTGSGRGAGRGAGRGRGGK